MGPNNQRVQVPGRKEKTAREDRPHNGTIHRDSKKL